MVNSTVYDCKMVKNQNLFVYFMEGKGERGVETAKYCSKNIALRTQNAKVDVTQSDAGCTQVHHTKT